MILVSPAISKMAGLFLFWSVFELVKQDLTDKIKNNGGINDSATGLKWDVGKLYCLK
tara:strand:- start:671 stop:841 length:171 start_codon:yes stop_codon:yes gene_type:complete